MEEKLLTPGPTQIPKRILDAMHRPAIHHRSDTFKKEFESAITGLKWFFNTQETPIILTCSGSGAMEAALLNIAAPGEEIVVLNAGAFGARWKDIGEKLGLKVVEIIVPWGDSPSIDACLEVLDKAPNARAFCVQQCETSTTVTHALNELLTIVRTNYAEMFTLVDSISACGSTPIPTAGECIDIYIAGSQKALMLPPGLAFLSLSERIWKHVEKCKRRSLYFDLIIERKAHKNGETAWTPATHLICGLNESLKMIKEEGLENVFSRHARLAEITRRGVKELGLKLITETHPSPCVTGFFLPSGKDPDTIREKIRETTGLLAAGGQGAWSGKIIRIGHMGCVPEQDILNFLGKLKELI